MIILVIQINKGPFLQQKMMKTLLNLSHFMKKKKNQ